jgi:predicted ATPase
MHVLGGLYAAAAEVFQFQRDACTAGERAKMGIHLGTVYDIPLWLVVSQNIQGWALATQGQVQEGTAYLEQGIAAHQGAEVAPWHPYYLALLAEAYGLSGDHEKGLQVLAKALVIVGDTSERFYEAEIHRLRGELTLQKFHVSSSEFQVRNRPRLRAQGSKSKNTDPRSLNPDPQGEAEECFHKAIEIARQQQAKSLELRAVMSLVRLRQRQAALSASRTTHREARRRLDDAHQMLAEIYGWFREGFDTKDLQEAKALLGELAA